MPNLRIEEGRNVALQGHEKKVTEVSITPIINASSSFVILKKFEGLLNLSYAMGIGYARPCVRIIFML